ncbi:MAG: EamA family transporter [Saprospiraceae bacterium]
MLYILLSILCSSALIIIFKLFERFNIDIFQAIVFNYITCVTLAGLSLGHFPVPIDVSSQPWFLFALVLGFCFITGFNAVGSTVKHFNMALASVMQKMSLLFAVTFTVLYYNESMSITKILGLIAAVLAIFLTSYASDTHESAQDDKKHSISNWLRFPILAWILSGVIDILLYYVEKEINKGSADIQFIATFFAAAGCLGIIALIRGYIKQYNHFAFKHIVGGICLGIPNFYSIYFLLMSFNQGYEGSLVFPITNVGIICISVLSGYFLFAEPLFKTKIIGIALAIIAIMLIAM